MLSSQPPPPQDHRVDRTRICRQRRPWGRIGWTSLAAALAAVLAAVIAAFSLVVLATALLFVTALGNYGSNK
jgi:hypothetical protein